MVKASDLISIIIPVYNVRPYVARCLDSVLKQTHTKLEIIIIDDGSTDGSGKICDDYAEKDARIRVIHRGNAGVSSARNLGKEIATGKWISYVDSDDTIEPNFCEEMLRCAKDKCVDYVCSGYKRIYPRGAEAYNTSFQRKVLKNDEFIYCLLNVQFSYGFVHMKLIKSDIAKLVTFDEKLEVGEDALYNLEVADKISEAAILEKPLYNYYATSNSVVKRWDKNYIKKYQKAVERIKAYMEEKYGNKYALEVENFVTYHAFLILVNFCCHNKNKDRLGSLKRLMKIPVFREAIDNSSFDNLSFTRRVTLYCMKRRLYRLCIFIGRLRQFMLK
ncbi:MAG: glycosyltransferase [Candidatus Saccharibacteria bacterium]|nr:glycosyltransferase [Candidatus Saccharibacteria bacterium]